MKRTTLSWRLLAGGPFAVAVATAVVTAALGALGALVAGRLADTPAWHLVAALGAVSLGQVALGTLQWYALSHAIGGAESLVRGRLLEAALGQRLPALEQQGVGELIDRIDDDPAQLATLLRGPASWAAQAILGAIAAWIVAGITWWPSWLVFPAIAAACLRLVLRRAPAVAARKAEEEAAWSEHSSQFEESIAARDELRTSLGREYAVRQYALRAAEVLRRVRATAKAATAVSGWVGLLLNLLIAALVVAGAAFVARGSLGVAELVTLWFLVVGFVGALGNVANNLPDIQSGLGAAQRISALLSAPQDPVGGVAVPDAAPTVSLRGLSFAYDEGFAIGPIDLEIPAGTSCALVGRTGSGKSTLVKLLVRAIEPPTGTLFFDGSDTRGFDLAQLRQRVGVIGQRTQLLAATLFENVTLFGEASRDAVDAAFAQLGLTAWVASLPDGLDTRLGSEPGAVTLSAGEEQLVAFARLMVREVRVVVLDEATARMDPITARRVTEATDRLLAGRTGVVVAHRLDTIRHADRVVVLEAGRVLEQGSWAELSSAEGAFAALLAAMNDAGETDARGPGREHAELVRRGPAAAAAGDGESASLHEPERGRGAGSGSGRAASLLGTVLRFMAAFPRWGVGGDISWFFGSLVGAFGIVTGLLWGHLVAALQAGDGPWPFAIALAAGVLISPWLLAIAASTHPRWTAGMTLSLRLAVLRGQTRQHRLPGTAPAEVVSRALDSTRLTTYIDHGLGIPYGVLFAVLTGVLSGGPLAGLLAGAVMVLSAVASVAGVKAVGAAGAATAEARVGFGRVLGSVLEAAQTVKLAGASEAVLAHVRGLDGRRVAASVRENGVSSVPWIATNLLVQGGVVAGWALHVGGLWTLATALLLNTVLGDFSWFGFVTGQVVTGTPATRRWLRAASALAGTRDLVSIPAGIDIVRGTAPAPAVPPREPLRTLGLEGVGVVHDDGTIGVADVSLELARGEMTVIAGRIGSGKSSLLAALAGLVDSSGALRWNGSAVVDPQAFLRPGNVAYVPQLPRVVSGTLRENIGLDHAERDDVLIAAAVGDAQLGPDVAAMPDGLDSLVGHRGVRLSGGQAQRVALARALAADAEILVADDVSSALDARTEALVWAALRARGVTVVASSSRLATLAAADRVVVLERGRVAAVGPWQDLADSWGHLAG